MWRIAGSSDDEAITAMFLALNQEDPGPEPVAAEQVRRTLHVLRDQPQRGRALVLELEGDVRGYALVMSFWSNELGGEILAIDELYVTPEYRGRGHGTDLMEQLAAGTFRWASDAVALTLEVSPTNAGARRLYERLGFTGRNLAMRRRLRRRP